MAERSDLRPQPASVPVSDGSESARIAGLTAELRDDLILLFVRTIQGFMSADADLIVDNAMRLADAVLECYVLEEISHDDA